MNARRQRFLGGLVIVAGALSANALLDYRLILRNPAELEEICRNALEGIFPEYAPHMGRAPEFFLSERKAVIHDVVFHEKGQSGRTLFRVGTLEAYFQLVPPALVRLEVREPEATIRIDREGKVNFETGGEVTGGPPTLYADLDVVIEGGQLRIVNDRDGEGTDLVLTDVHAQLTVTRDLALKGGGATQLGLVVPLGQEGGTHSARGLDMGQRLKPLAAGLRWSVERKSSGRVLAEANLDGGELSASLRRVIPPLFRKTIWDELDPSGTFDARVRVDAEERGVRVTTTVLPRAAIRPRGFPIDITDVTGRFEVNVFVPPAAPGPTFLGVSWDGVRAAVAGGTVASRGAVFPGDEGERVSLYLTVDARRLALTDALENAFPPDIREVYDEFDPQGTIERAQLVIFKGPNQEDPQLSVEIADLAGALSATYRDVPLELRDLRGSFRIREDANVEIHARGAFAAGGRAEVDAHVVRGELMHVDVRGLAVPVGPEIVDRLPGRARAIVAGFRPSGGEADVRVVVEKPHARALAQPTIDVDLRDVAVAHEAVPYPLTASGHVRIVPRFPEGALPDEAPDPERIEVGLDLAGWGRGVVAATASGTLVMPAGGGPFEGELQVRAAQVTLDQGLRDALPPALATVWEQLSPSGVVRRVECTVSGPERLRARGEGAGLQVRVAQFPLPLRIDAFDLSRDGRTIRLTEARAGALGGGTLLARGVILQPPSGRPMVDLDLVAQDMPVDQDLVRAMPAGAARDLLEGMKPEGRAAATLRLLVPPGDGPPQVDGRVDLSSLQAYLHPIDPALAGLSEEPIRHVAGTIHLQLPRRVELTALRGELAGAQVETTGVIGSAPPTPDAMGALGGLGGALAAAGLNDPATIDLTVHVGHLVVDERVRAMAGAGAADVFERFQPDGPLDLQARVRRAPLAPRTSVRLRARPRGMSALPSLLPLAIRDLEGEVEVLDGEPIFIDLTARVGGGTLIVRRDRSLEGRFPDGGRAGRVFEVALRDFARPTDPRERVELELKLPDPGPVRTLLSSLRPEGPLDVHAFVYQPLEERRPVRWVAEVRFGPREAGDAARPHFAVNAGLPFDGIRGLVRVSGSIPELERGSCEGEVELAQLECYKQTARNVRGKFRLADGVLSFGLRGEPVFADFYGGRLKVIAEYALQSGEYRGWVGLEEARLQRAMEELGELRTDSADRTRLMSELTHALQKEREVESRLRRLERERADDEATDAPEAELDAADDAIDAAEDELALAEERVKEVQARVDQLPARVAGRAFTGLLDAQLAFYGGGKSLSGRDAPLDGSGWVRIHGTNLLLVPGFDSLRIMVDAFRGRTSRPLAFETMRVDMGLRADRLALRSVALTAPSGFTLYATDAEVLLPSGELRNLTMRPIDTNIDALARVLENVPLTGFNIQGKLWDPVPVPLPLASAVERFLRWVMPGGDEDDAMEPPAPERDD